MSSSQPKTKADLFIAVFQPAKAAADQAPDYVQERDGVLVDTRFCSDVHQRRGEWQYDGPMGRRICKWCFSGGYPVRPVNPCPICKEAAWYERKPEHGGGWICGRCYGGLGR